MRFINLLDHVSKGYYDKKVLPDAFVYGVIRCTDEGSFGGRLLNFKGIPAILDVALISHPGGEEYSIGNMGIVLPDESWVGKPVVVGKNSSRGVRIDRQLNSSIKPEGGINAFSFRKGSEAEWDVVPNWLKELDDRALEKKGLTGIIVPTKYGWCVDYSKMAGGTSVPFYHSFSSKEARKPISITGVPEKLDQEEPKVWPLEKRSNGFEQPDDVPPVMEEPAWEEPEYFSEQEQVVSSGAKLVFRSEAKSASKILNAVRSELDSCITKRDSLQEDLFSWIRQMEPFAEGRVLRTYNAEVVRKMGRSTSSKERGSAIVRELLERMAQLTSKGEDESKADIDVLVKQLKAGVLNLPSAMPNLSDSLEMIIVSQITGVSLVEKLAKPVKKHRLPWEGVLSALLCNPYKVGMLMSLTVNDADVILSSISQVLVPEEFFVGEDELLFWRNNLMVLNRLAFSPSDRTLIPKRDVIRGEDSFFGVTYEKFSSLGWPWTSKKTTRRLNMMGWVTEKRAAFDLSHRSLSETNIEFCEDNGLILEVTGKSGAHLGLVSQAEKEFFIYESLHSRSTRPSGVTEEIVSKNIEKFEAMKGFKLEDLQKSGVGIVRHQAGVLSGCAGSGKTTVSECMTLCIEDALPEFELCYAAPTGKAARRLAEVVQRPVRTIHSLFGLAIGDSVDYFSPKFTQRRVVSESPRCYILDEMAMSSMELLFQTVQRIRDEDMVFFLGDVKQLKPIGKGIPFKDLMNFMPCVELGVSKRAAEGSGINLNCDIINSFSDPGNFRELEVREDFRIKHCPDEDIAAWIKKVVLWEKDKRGSLDDVQIVSPYAKKTKPWSSTALNQNLHSVFNPNDDLLTVGWGEWAKTFKKDDRVIHVNSNKWNYKRYLRSGDVFTEVETLGVANGEMGTLRGYIRSTDVTFVSYDGERESEVEPREDESFVSDDLFFILVEFQDVDLGVPVYVLYHAREKGIAPVEYGGKEFHAGDMENLELAYALTTHKMQGSQAPVVILPIGSKDSPAFVNRNMVYTAISRASERVYLLGSVGVRGSRFDRCRTQFSSEKVSLLNLLSKDKL